jgi:hypothetical protein
VEEIGLGVLTGAIGELIARLAFYWRKMEYPFEEDIR